MHAPSMLTMYTSTPMFCDWLREMSDGRIDVTLFAGGELVGTKDIADALATGVIELAFTTSSSYTGAVPDVSFAACAVPPLLWQGPNDVYELYWGLELDELLREAWAENGIYFLTTAGTGAVTFWSKEPMYHVEDLEGFKVRFYGAPAQTMEKLGATPVFLPHKEVYTALATGTVDGSGTSLMHYEGMKYYELCPYVYAPAWKQPEAMDILMSLDAWNELPDDLKAVVKVASRAYAHDLTIQSAWFEAAIIGKLDGWGSTLITWSKEDVKKVSIAALSLLPELAARSPKSALGYTIIEKFAKEKGYIE